MLVYVVEFGPAALAFGVLLVAPLILNRRRSARWLRFQTRLKSRPQIQKNLLRSGYYLTFGLLLALGAFLASRLGKPPVLAYTFWIFWGVFMAISMPLIDGLFKKQQEPEDWLLWDKEEAQNH